MSITERTSIEKSMNIDEMNSGKTFDDFLAKHLQTEHDYIDDGGFTANVMASLPVSKTLNPWIEKLILGLPVLLIAAMVLSQFPWRDMVQPAYAILLTMNIEVVVKAGMALLALMSAATAFWGAKRLDFI